MAGDGDMFAQRTAWGYSRLCAAASNGAPTERLGQIEVQCVRNMLVLDCGNKRCTVRVIGWAAFPARRAGRAQPRAEAVRPRPWEAVYKTKRALKGRQSHKAMPQSLARRLWRILRRPDGGCDELRRYIRDQREHHRQVSYQDEFRAFLRRYEIEYDERYVWD